MSLPLKTEQARNAVLNIFPEAAKDRARPAVADLLRPTAARINPALLVPEATKPAEPPLSSSQRNSQAAFELLDQASNIIPVLMARCRQLESDLQASRDKARGEMEAAELVAQRYQTIIQELQAKIKALQGELQAMSDRTSAVESQNEAIQIAADRTRQQAAEADCLTALFHDKVMAALGNNSPAHAVLQAMRQGAEPPRSRAG